MRFQNRVCPVFCCVAGKTMITTHTDVVGSLLRPGRLLNAQEDFAAERITETDFKKVEDRAVDQAIAIQEEVGLGVVTDGEMRRQSFQSQMTEAVDGFGEYALDAFLWGNWKGDDSVGGLHLERPTALGVERKLRRRRHLSVDEFNYLRDHTTRIPKVTLPSPSLWANFWSPDRSTEAYPSLDHFLSDVAIILRDEVTDLVRLGARYIQLDAPHYTLLIDPKTRAFYEAQGWNLDRWVSAGIELDNAVMGDFPGMTFGFHL